MNQIEFAQSIKKKYPQYKDIDDTELARKVISKYPVYKDQVTFTETQQSKPTIGQTALGVAKDTGQTLLNIPKNALQASEGLGNMTAQTLANIAVSPKYAAKTAISDIGNTGNIMADKIAEGLANVTNQPIGKTLTDVATYAKKNPLDVIGGIPGAGKAALTGVGRAVEKIGAIRPREIFIPSDSKLALFKAIKPGNKKDTFMTDLEKEMGTIKATADRAGKPINGIDDMIGNIKTAKKGIWNDIEKELNSAERTIETQKVTLTRTEPTKILDPKGKPFTKTVEEEYEILKNGISGEKIADAIDSNIDARLMNQYPGEAEKIRRIADTYRWQKKPVIKNGVVVEKGIPRKLTFKEAEDYLESANNELDSFYQKSPRERTVYEKDPEKGYVVRERNALQGSVNEALDKLSNERFGELKRKYGRLSNIQRQAQNRVNVAKRQQFNSLSEQMTAASAAGDAIKSVADLEFGTAAKGVGKYMTARWLKEANSTDNLIKMAFENIDNAKGKPISYSKGQNLPTAAYYTGRANKEMEPLMASLRDIARIKR